MVDSPNPENDLFYFETDSLALKSNTDYNEAMKTLFLLCAQRERAIKNYSRAVELKKEALEDPTAILEKICNGESLGMPDMFCVPEIPVVDWSKYNVKIPEETLKSIYSDCTDEIKKKKAFPAKERKIAFGAKWTAEEQRRLEELLHFYPPETVEVRRYKKIAEALGTRTVKQVTSRVQKYFIKLYKAGLPVPGRLPKTVEKFKKTASHKHQRHNHYLLKPSTFFPDLCLPVAVNDLQDAPGPSNHLLDEPIPSTSSTPTSIKKENGNGTDKSDTDLQIELLKRVRDEKLRENSEPFLHIGFKCDQCNEEPIKGARWHCTTCKIDSVDFCTDCVISQMYSSNCHPLHHNFIKCCDNKVNMDVSDSESPPGSPSGSCSILNFGTNTNSSDSEFSEGDEEEEPTNSINGLDEFKDSFDFQPCSSQEDAENGDFFDFI